jgi:colanic acid biosynthesis glycosyl transferase WcaI
LNILIYSIFFWPELTGISKYTGEMAFWLASRGHSVDVITALPHYPAWRVDDDYRKHSFMTEQNEGVRIFRAPLYLPRNGKVTTRSRILTETTFATNALRWWTPKLFQNYDVLFCVCPPLQLSFASWFYSMFRGVPWVLHVQDLQVDAAIRLDMLKNKGLGSLLFSAENFLLKRATYVSTITESMRSRLIDKGVAREKTFVFPNWSDTTFVRPLERLNPMRQTLGVAPDEIVVLYAGNMGEKQGLELVLAAAERLRSNSRFKFRMVGAGAARERLEQEAKERRLDNVAFYDLFPWEDMPSLLAAGDIHLVVQKREAADLVMPSKLTNILSAGRVSLATADPGTALHQVLTEHQAGVVVEPGVLETFVAALEKLAHDKTMRESMGKNARVYAETFLERDAVLTRFETQLADLVAGYNSKTSG